MNSKLKTKMLAFSLLLILIISCTNPQETKNSSPMPDNDSTLVLELDAQYIISHGWGHVYKCAVKQVVKGELKMDTIALNVYATTDLYNGLLTEIKSYPNLTIAFEKTDRPYGPPPGFRDKQDIWWEIINVKQNNP